MLGEVYDERAAEILATSTRLTAAVALADEVRAILHDRGEVPDAELVDQIDAAFDRYWAACKGTSGGA